MKETHCSSDRVERINARIRESKRKLLKRQRDARESHTDPQRRVSHKEPDKRKARPL